MQILWIAVFKPSVTGRAWGKTGARIAGGAGAVLRLDHPTQSAGARRDTGALAALAFGIHVNCYNFVDRQTNKLLPHCFAPLASETVRGWPNVSHQTYQAP
jgi:hypothetical protein